MLDNLERMKAISTLAMKEAGVDFSSKDELYAFLESTDKESEMSKSDAAYLLYGKVTPMEVLHPEWLWGDKRRGL